VILCFFVFLYVCMFVRLCVSAVFVSTVHLTVAQLKLNILVAEDNAVNQQVISRLLNKLNHKAVIVGNGKLAVEEFERNGNSFDLILMDVQMPVMDGVEATTIVCLFLFSLHLSLHL
jgi:PleD family two-component response regulator